MDLEDEMSKDKKALLEEFERRRKARQLNVSTDDDEVTYFLRMLLRLGRSIPESQRTQTNKDY